MAYYSDLIRTQEARLASLEWKNDDLKMSISNYKIQLKGIKEEYNQKKTELNSLITNCRKLRDPRRYKNKNLSFENLVLNVAADIFNVPVLHIKSKSRKRERVMARNCISAILYKYLNKGKNKISYAKIGKFLGGKDHASIMHGIETHYLDLERDLKYRLQTESIIEIIFKDA